MNKQKQKKYPPPQPILSRSSRIKKKNLEFLDDVAWVLNITNLVPDIKPWEMSKEQLEEEFKKRKYPLCDKLMRFSCGNNGKPRDNAADLKWEELTPLEKWRLVGGRCPNEDDDNEFDIAGICSSGCVSLSDFRCI